MPAGSGVKQKPRFLARPQTPGSDKRPAMEPQQAARKPAAKLGRLSALGDQLSRRLGESPPYFGARCLYGI